MSKEGSKWEQSPESRSRYDPGVGEGRAAVSNKPYTGQSRACGEDPFAAWGEGALVREVVLLQVTEDLPALRQPGH